MRNPAILPIPKPLSHKISEKKKTELISPKPVKAVAKNKTIALINSFENLRVCELNKKT